MSVMQQIEFQRGEHDIRAVDAHAMLVEKNFQSLPAKSRGRLRRDAATRRSSALMRETISAAEKGFVT